MARTSFFDEAVLRAIADGRHQVLLLGAGYDMRAHRFRTPGVRFLEVDHPATQTDKRRRLELLGLDRDDIGFVAADFIEPGLDALLDAAGHRRDQATLFILEGVLRYLPEHAFRGLLATLAHRAAPGSELAVSISCQPTGEPADQAEARRTREHRLAESGEAVLTMPPREVALRWLEEAGWTADSVVDVADLVPDARPGRLLVRAHP
jgi:methyltransferase (TIGR00027 family)